MANFVAGNSTHSSQRSGVAHDVPPTGPSNSVQGFDDPEYGRLPAEAPNGTITYCPHHPRIQTVKTNPAPTNRNRPPRTSSSSRASAAWRTTHQCRGASSGASPTPQRKAKSASKSSTRKKCEHPGVFCRTVSDRRRLHPDTLIEHVEDPTRRPPRRDSGKSQRSSDGRRTRSKSTRSSNKTPA